jgi:acyl-CoA thioesterase
MSAASDGTTDARPDAQDVAERSAAAMERADEAMRSAGIRLLAVGPGWARTGMTVAAQHLNGHGLCHGGYLFLLADAALAFASNSHGVPTVASGADIVFLRPGAPGDELVADARERVISGRSGLYDVTVTTAGTTVAEFRGRTRNVPGLPPPR